MDMSNDEKDPVYRGFNESEGQGESAYEKMSKWKKTLLFIILGLGGILTISIMRRMSAKESEKKKLRERVRYFKPTITETALSKSISWEMRDKPLTDEQLDGFMKSEKLM